MLTFLKKLGIILAKVGAVAAGVYPLVQPMLGSGKAAAVTTTVVNDFTLIMQRVVEIETALQGKPGTEKLSAAIPLIKNIVATSEAVAGKKIANEPLFDKGCEEVTQGVVDILNSIHPDAAQ